MLRDPPLCQYWQLAETGPQTYDLAWLMKAHEAMDMEDLARTRVQKALEAAAKKD